MYSDDEFNDLGSESTKSNGLSIFYNNSKALVWIFIIVVICVVALIILSNKQGDKSDNKVEVKIDATEPVIVAIGTSTKLTAKVKNGESEDIVWSSEDITIATVDETGNVEGVNYGKTKITATYIQSDNEKKTDTVEVIVADGDPNIELKNVSFRDGDLFMPVDQSYKILLSLSPSKAYIENKKFTSSDESVVKVDENGVVTAVGEGEATITFDVNNGTFKKELRVYVNRDYTKSEIVVTPTNITLDGELRKIKVGTKEKIKYTVEPENTDKEKLIWTSSDEEIVKIDEYGRLIGVQKGNAKVTLSSVNGIKDEIDIEVEDDIVEVTDISLSVSEITLSVGEVQTIVPIVSPDNASNKALSFQSKDESIATSRGNETGVQGTIMGISVGSTIVSIKSTNGIEKEITVIVKNPSKGGTDDTKKGGSKTVTPDPTPSSKTTTKPSATSSTKATLKPTATSSATVTTKPSATSSTKATPKPTATVSVTPTPTPTIDPSSSYKCHAGYYLTASGNCKNCLPDYYCPGDDKYYKCPNGTSTNGADTVTDISDCKGVPTITPIVSTGAKLTCNEEEYTGRKVKIANCENCTIMSVTGSSGSIDSGEESASATSVGTYKVKAKAYNTSTMKYKFSNNDEYDECTAKIVPKSTTPTKTPQPIAKLTCETDLLYNGKLITIAKCENCVITKVNDGNVNKLTTVSRVAPAKYDIEALANNGFLFADGSNYNTCTATILKDKLENSCPKGQYLTDEGKCRGCVYPYYCRDSVEYRCPNGKMTKKDGASDISDCEYIVNSSAKCGSGYYLVSGNCTICKTNYMCPGDDHAYYCGKSTSWISSIYDCVHR